MITEQPYTRAPAQVGTRHEFARQNYRRKKSDFVLESPNFSYGLEFELHQGALNQKSQGDRLQATDLLYMQWPVVAPAITEHCPQDEIFFFHHPYLLSQFNQTTRFNFIPLSVFSPAGLCLCSRRLEAVHKHCQMQPRDSASRLRPLERFWTPWLLHRRCSNALQPVLYPESSAAHNDDKGPQPNAKVKKASAEREAAIRATRRNRVVCHPPNIGREAHRNQNPVPC